MLEKCLGNYTFDVSMKLRKEQRYIVYFLIGVIIYFIIDGENMDIEEFNDWMLPLLVVVLVLIFGLRFWANRRGR